MRWLLALLAVSMLLLGCTLAKDSEFTIKITGSDGLSFSGSYLATKANGTTQSRSVDGTVPAEYKVVGTLVSVSFQKQVEKGTLRVQIFKNREVVGQSDTSAAYGVVLVATR